MSNNLTTTTRKVVYNGRHGGFSLSPIAMVWLHRRGLDGITMALEDHYRLDSFPTDHDIEVGLTNYVALCDELDGRPTRFKVVDHIIGPRLMVRGEDGVVRILYNDHHIKRDEPLLAACVEELGDRANGFCASLRIKEIPADDEYHIHEYDGLESVMRGPEPESF